MLRLAVMSDNVKISYEDEGYGPAVLLIHGWGATKNFWRSIRGIEGFRLIIPDLRGHGESDRSKDYRRERIILDMYELITGLGVRELSIVGHSLGGIIATKLAVSFPELKVGKLILVATPPEFRIGTPKRIIMGLMLYLLTPIMKRTFTPKTLHDPKTEILRFIWRESARGSKKAYMKFLAAFDNASIIDDLDEIKAQKIAIIPSDDKIVPTEYQREIYSELCDKTIIIEDAGHNVMLEKPEEFRKVLENILRE